MFRPSHVVVVGALALTASACSDTTNAVFPFNSAVVRLVNATDTPITLSVSGVPDSANSRLVFGQSSACVLIDLSNRVSVITVTNNAAGGLVPFSPILSPGDNLTVVAFGATAGVIQLATLNNRFVPTINSAGLRFFNGVASTGPLFMQRSGVALTPFVQFGTASGFVTVPTDSASITFANGLSVVLDAGRLAFPVGQNSTVVVGPPAAGTDPLRFFTVQAC